MSKPEGKLIDWEFCLCCKQKINILGDQFCSTYCVQQYNIEKNTTKVEKKFKRNFD